MWTRETSIKPEASGIFHPLQLAGQSQYSSDHSSTKMNLSQRTLCYYFLRHRQPLFCSAICIFRPVTVSAAICNSEISPPLFLYFLVTSPYLSQPQLNSFYLASSHTVLCARSHSIYTDFQLTLIDVKVATNGKYVRGIMLYWQFFPFILCQVRKHQNVRKVPSLWTTFTKYFFRFQCHTTEAAKLETEVTKAQDTITAAQQLISQLDGEHTRWNTQVWYECGYLHQCETHLLRKGLICHVRATGGEGATEMEGDRQGDVSCCLESLLAVFTPL